VFNVIFDEAVAVIATVAFGFSIYCGLLPCENLLSLLLVLSRMIFVASYILIITSQYEYHARFVLSVAQSCFGCVIAIVVTCTMCKYEYYPNLSKKIYEIDTSRKSKSSEKQDETRNQREKYVYTKTKTLDMEDFILETPFI
jgi:hypothetical protein